MDGTQAKMFCHTVGCRLSKGKVGAGFIGEVDSGKGHEKVSRDSEGLREDKSLGRAVDMS